MFYSIRLHISHPLVFHWHKDCNSVEYNQTWDVTVPWLQVYFHPWIPFPQHLFVPITPLPFLLFLPTVFAISILGIPNLWVLLLVLGCPFPTWSGVFRQCQAADVDKKKQDTSPWGQGLNSLTLHNECQWNMQEVTCGRKFDCSMVKLKDMMQTSNPELHNPLTTIKKREKKRLLIDSICIFPFKKKS